MTLSKNFADSSKRTSSALWTYQKCQEPLLGKSKEAKKSKRVSKRTTDNSSWRKKIRKWTKSRGWYSRWYRGSWSRAVSWITKQYFWANCWACWINRCELVRRIPGYWFRSCLLRHFGIQLAGRNIDETNDNYIINDCILRNEVL